MSSQSPAAPLGDLVRAADAASEVARRAAGWTPQERRAFVDEVDRATTALAAARAAVLVAERDAGTWRGNGDATFEAWRSRTSRTGMRAASAEVRRGEALRSMPALQDAAQVGHVSVEHVDAVARVASGASGPVRDALATAQGQAELVGMARRLDAGRFARAAAVWAASIDQGSVECSHQAQRAARFLTLVDGDDGTRISGRLDRMAGHRVRLALEALTGRPAADDERSPEQRGADALDAMAEKLLSLPETGSGAAVRPHVSFVMPAETWAAMRAARTAREAAGRGDRAEGAAAAGLRGVAPVLLEEGLPVPPSEVARVLCDCELTRIVTDAESVPVDLGRTQRVFTREQRRAVTARDGGCLWPGCGTPVRWCEVHHVRWWDRDGGETSVDCGALVCSFHHHEIHRRELAVRRVLLPPGAAAPGTRPVRYVVAAPDGSTVADGRVTAVEVADPGAGGAAPPRDPCRQPEKQGGRQAEPMAGRPPDSLIERPPGRPPRPYEEPALVLL